MNENDLDDRGNARASDMSGSYPVDLSIADDAIPAPSPVRPGLSRRTRITLFVLAGCGVLAVLFAGGWMFVYSQMPVPVPDVVALTPAAAEQRLVAGGLKAGAARMVATKEFPPGRVIAQEPKPFATIPRGSSVDVSVSVAPTAQLVPNVTFARQADAEQGLRALVFVPVVLDQYSPSVPVGDVVSQLPRAGDTAFSGGNVFVVVSLGPGTKGSVVPNLVGKTTRVAASLLASQTLFPYTRIVNATGVTPGTIVDQAPAPGAIMMVGSSVGYAVTTR